MEVPPLMEVLTYVYLFFYMRFNVTLETSNHVVKYLSTWTQGIFTKASLLFLVVIRQKI